MKFESLSNWEKDSPLFASCLGKQPLGNTDHICSLLMKWREKESLRELFSSGRRGGNNSGNSVNTRRETKWKAEGALVSAHFYKLIHRASQGAQAGLGFWGCECCVRTQWLENNGALPSHFCVSGTWRKVGLGIISVQT